jgi:lactate permease
VPNRYATPISVRSVGLQIKLLYFEADPNLTNATVIEGLLAALTPISITSGAIFMFKTMEASGSMEVIRRWLNEVSDNPVAQLMIIGWVINDRRCEDHEKLPFCEAGASLFRGRKS